MLGFSKAAKLKKQHDLEKVVREYGGELKRKGSSLMCRCPFPDHETKHRLSRLCLINSFSIVSAVEERAMSSTLWLRWKG